MNDGSKEKTGKEDISVGGAMSGANKEIKEWLGKELQGFSVEVDDALVSSSDGKLPLMAVEGVDSEVVEKAVKLSELASEITGKVGKVMKVVGISERSFSGQEMINCLDEGAMTLRGVGPEGDENKLIMTVTEKDTRLIRVKRGDDGLKLKHMMEFRMLGDSLKLRLNGERSQVVFELNSETGKMKKMVLRDRGGDVSGKFSRVWRDELTEKLGREKAW